LGWGWDGPPLARKGKRCREGIDRHVGKIDQDRHGGKLLSRSSKSVPTVFIRLAIGAPKARLKLNVVECPAPKSAFVFYGFGVSHARSSLNLRAESAGRQRESPAGCRWQVGIRRTRQEANGLASGVRHRIVREECRRVRQHVRVCKAFATFFFYIAEKKKKKKKEKNKKKKKKG